MKKLLNLTSFILVFIMPIVVIFHRYETEESEKTVTVESGIPFIPTMFLTIILLVLLFFLVANFKEMIKKKPFGTLSIATYSTVMGGLVFISWLWLKSITNAAQSNLEAFTKSFEYHQETLYIILIFIVVGVITLFGEYIVSIIRKATSIFTEK